MNPNAGYDIERELVPVINLAWQPNIIAAASAFPAASLGELIKLTRTRKSSYGSPGTGSVPHLAGVYLFTVRSARSSPAARARPSA